MLFGKNILLDVNGSLKISDFGFATLHIETNDDKGNLEVELLHSTCGTPNYVAPEVLKNCGYNGKISDIWSCGVILFVLLAGYLPFEEERLSVLFAKIKAAIFEFPLWFSYDAKDILRRILVPDPVKRLTLENIKSHRWMAIDSETSALLSCKRDSTSTPPSSHLCR